MAPQHVLSPEDFSHVVRLTPLVSIDLILSEPEGRVLVGYRNNEPAKGIYFVPGGRINKDERLDAAFARIVQNETGLYAERKFAEFLGVYEHLYDTSRYGGASFGTHYVVLAYRLQLPRRPKIVLDDQHSVAKWMTPEEILAAPDVHEYTKAYFR